MSPYLYDEKLGVRAFISNKDQFIYAICLDCLSGNGKKHEINCVSCKQAWTHGNSLQIIRTSLDKLLFVFTNLYNISF